MQANQAADDQTGYSRGVQRLLTRVETICKSEKLMGQLEAIRSSVIRSALDWFQIQEMEIWEKMRPLINTKDRTY